MSQPFAVFDIDGTIFRSSLFLELVYRAVKDGVLPEVIKKDSINAYETWLKRKSSSAYEDYISIAVNSFDKNLKGVNAIKLQKIAKQVVDDYHEHTYVYTRDLLKSLKQKGYFLIAISGSTEEVVIEFTKHYNFDYVKASCLHIKDGLYTGTYNLADKDKHIALNKIVKDHDLTFDNSYGIGDSSSDISMLEVVENPIAFNPDRLLFKEANSRSWKIIVERKNMVYELEDKNGSYILAKTNA
jgi:HAD superfamily hydrolase (TIGR01490 family)